MKNNQIPPPLFPQAPGVFQAVCLAGVFFATSSLSIAAPPSDAPSKGGGKASPSKQKSKHGSSRIGRNFKTLDLDGDGFLHFEEFSKNERLARMDEEKKKKLFDYLDRNKDGKLHPSELRSHQPPWLVELRKSFPRLDNDQSGGLNLEEFSKTPHISKMDKNHIQKIFMRIDRNQDGIIQRAELKGMGGGGPGGACPVIDLKKYDSSQSGGLDFNEFVQMPWVSRIPEERQRMLFKKLDLNSDGEISGKEVKAAWSARRRHGPPPHAGPHHRKPKRNKRPQSDGARRPQRGEDSQESRGSATEL